MSSPTHLPEAIDRIVQRFQRLSDPKQRYEQLILYGKKLEAFPEALKIDGKSLGTEHPGYAASLNNLAALYESMGQYEQALPLSQQALEICGKSLGTDHPNYASSLNHLAALSKYWVA